MTDHHNDTDPTLDRSKVTLQAGDPDRLGVDGVVNTYPSYRFQAKVYDIGSEFGIEGGRVSKLRVWEGDAECFSYSRGWDQRPRHLEHFDVLQTILDGFPDPTNGASPAPTEEAHWLSDGETLTLFVRGNARAEVHCALNMVRFPPGQDENPNEYYSFVPLHRSAMTEAALAVGEMRRLTVLGHDGSDCPGRRLELELRADYWKTRDYLAEPPLETTDSLLAHSTRCLNSAACGQSLSMVGDQARERIADVRVLLNQIESSELKSGDLRYCADIARNAVTALKSDVELRQSRDGHQNLILAANPASFRASEYCARSVEHLEEGARRFDRHFDRQPSTDSTPSHAEEFPMRFFEGHVMSSGRKR